MLDIFRCVRVDSVLCLDDDKVSELSIFICWWVVGWYIVVFFVELVVIDDILDFVVVCLSVVILGCVVVKCRECSVSILNNF